MNNPLLVVNHLQVQIPSGNKMVYAVNEVSFKIHQGEIFALVGESGSGKTMTALSINRLLPLRAQLCQGSEIFLNDNPIHQLSENKMKKIRADHIGMIFQDPASALNPVLTIGDQVMEAIKKNKKDKRELKKEALALLEKVRIPEPDLFLQYYPHQLSGGMKQRIVIAMALAKSPDLLIADEPTTALDVTTQAQVLHLIKELSQQLNMAVLFIAHDLGVVGQMADTVAVMYAGHLIEQSSKDIFLSTPRHPYTQRLFSSLPERTHPESELSTIKGQVPSLDQLFPLCRFKERCPMVFRECEKIKPRWTQLNQTEYVRCHWYDSNILEKYPNSFRIEKLQAIEDKRKVQEQCTFSYEEEPVLLKVDNLKVHFPIKEGVFKKTIALVKAVDDLSLVLREGEILALVGESGCGKTTVGKTILKLIDPTSGKIEFKNKNLLKLSGRKLKGFRGECQMIFQDPYSSMDPRMSVLEILEEGMIALNIGTDSAERADRIHVLLEQVGLSKSMKWRYPHELSGGQRQRVAIARALAVGAQLVVCDEPTSALDLSVQAQILNLLKSLQKDLVISYLFITHNISIVNYLSDTIAVMYLGRIVEYGPAQKVLASPKHPYTQALLEALPSLSKESSMKVLKGEVPSPRNPPIGCHFAPRCPHVHERCLHKYPDSYSLDSKHRVSCYLYSPEEKK